MLRFLPAPLQGSIMFMALTVNTILCSLLVYVVALLKLLLPSHRWRIVCSKLANSIAQDWVGINSLGLKLAKNIRWDVQGIDALQTDAWYLLVANHQSMVDIVVLQSIFHRKIPFLKFFIKRELIWVPFLGIVWWTLDFPFMKRTASAGRDMETARIACDKFRLLPVTIMNFVEGTRFTTAKREKDNSPFTYLLRPKPGGMAVVLCTLGQRLHSILDVTIVYPEGTPGLWTLLCSSSMEIKVRVKQIPVTPELLGDYLTDREFRRRFKDWLDKLWAEKDKLIGTLLPMPAQKSDGAGDN
ncbi:MAG: acyltransferase [Syntrophobacteraceae bacterium]